MGALAASHDDIFRLVLRPYSYCVLIAMLIMVATIIVLARNARLQGGAYYWFFMFNIGNLLFLSLTFLNVSAVTASASAYWQGFMPLGWIPLGLMLLFFTLSYIDNTDVPHSLGLFVIPLACLLLFMFIAGVSNVIQPHIPVPHQTYSPYWGYQNPSGDLGTIIFVWLALIAIMALVLFIRAYRRSVSDSNRRQLKLFIIGLGQYITLAIALDFILYSINPNVPTFAVLYNTVLCVILNYAILKHGLFRIDAQSLAAPVLDNMAEAVVVVNAGMVIEYTNRSSETMFGLPQRPLRGQPLQSILAAAEYGEVQRRLTTAPAGFVLDDIPVHNLDSAKTLPVSVNVSEFRHGQVLVGYVFVMQNISELKRKTLELAEEKRSVEGKVQERTKELHDERAKLQASIESLEIGFVFLDPHGKIIIQNRALTNVLSLRSLRTVADFEQLLPQLGIKAYLTAAASVGMKSQIAEMNFEEKTLKTFMTAVHSDSDGAENGFIGIMLLVEDITEEKVLQRSRDEFFSIASHELRTPLTAIRGNSGMILDMYDAKLKDSDFTQGMTDIHEASIRLIDIVNDFLDTSRLEQGKLRFDIQPCEIDSVLEGIMYEIKASAREKHLHITCDTMTLGRLPKVMADPARLKQILYNLLSNAIKYTDKGSVSVSAKQVNDMIQINVADTGHGIPSELRRLLFHKFQQAGDNILTRDNTRGTGLGLYISRLMARGMGGEVELVSSKTNSGSVFAVTLPIAPAAKPASSVTKRT